MKTASRILVHLVPVLALAAGPAACTTSDGEPNAQEESKMVTLSIVKEIAGEPLEVGVLTFDQRRRGNLAITWDGPEGQALRQHWKETSALPSLELETSRQAVRDGNKVTEYITEVVKPGDEDYPWAVLDYLQRTYHYTVTVAEPTK